MCSVEASSPKVPPPLPDFNIPVSTSSLGAPSMKGPTLFI
jgi:hypothetical protein